MCIRLIPIRYHMQNAGLFNSIHTVIIELKVTVLNTQNLADVVPIQLFQFFSRQFSVCRNIPSYTKEPFWSQTSGGADRYLEASEDILAMVAALSNTGGGWTFEAGLAPSVSVHHIFQWLGWNFRVRFLFHNFITELPQKWLGIPILLYPLALGSWWVQVLLWSDRFILWS